jgi:thiol:disulfide interchange protein
MPFSELGLRRRSSLLVFAGLLASLLAPTSRAADGEPKKKDSPKFLQPKEVTWTTSVTPGKAKPGDTVTYSVTAAVAEPWHIYAYANEQPQEGPRATQFDLFALGELMPTGEWKSDHAPVQKKEPAFPDLPFVSFHDGKVTWSRTLKVPATATPGKVTIKSQAYFQICDPKSCKPPSRVTVPDATVTVEAARPRASRFAVLPLVAILTTPTAEALDPGSPAPKHKDSVSYIVPREVTWSTSVTPPSAMPGESVTYRVTAKIQTPWYIYTYVDHQDDPHHPGTQFDFFDPAGLAPRGGWAADSPVTRFKFGTTSSGAITFSEGYAKQVVWSTKVTIPADATPGTRTLKNQVRFQVCERNACKGPAYLTLPDAVVTVNEPRLNRDPGALPAPALVALVPLGAQDAVPPKPRKKDSPAINQPKEVTWTTSVSPANALPGATVTYAVTARVDAPWHIYAFDQQTPEQGPQPTQFDLFDPAGLAPSDDWTADDPPIKKAEPAFPKLPFVQFHTNQVTWSTKIRIPVDAAPGRRTLRTQVHFQICEPKACKPHTRMTLPDAVLTIKDGDEQANAAAFLVGGLIGFLPPPTDAIPPAAPPKAAAGTVQASIDQGLLSFLLFSAGGGLFAILMPCVWPMIPITVNFFVKQGHANKKRSTSLAITYCLAIIGIFTLVGLAVSAAFGSTGATRLGNNAWVNLLFALVFVAFGLSLLGLFEIRLPSSWLNASAQLEDKGGILGVFFMALTLTITSFTCTAPVVGSLLVMAAKGQYFYPVLGLLTFSTVLAIPFLVLALVPSLLTRMPRSGDWMNAVKVVGGLLEIGAALKFFNTFEVSLHGGDATAAFIDAQVVLASWVVLTIVCGIYLLGLFKTDHDHSDLKIGPARLVLGSLFLALGVYLAPAMFGNPPKSRFYEMIIGILPPDASELDSKRQIVAEILEIVGNRAPGENLTASRDFDPKSHQRDDEPERGEVSATSNDPKVAIRQARTFHGVSWGLSLAAALESAKAKRKPVLVDFTGVNCANCRTMEATIMPRPEVVKEMRHFITVQVYTDFVPIKSITEGEREDLAQENLQHEVELIKETTSPNYAVLDPDGKVVAVRSFDPSPSVFVKFLQDARAKLESTQKVAQAGG